MTASQIIDGLAPILVGTKYGDTSDSNIRAILLSYLNMAKNEIATDTLFWLGGEQITMISNIFEYTLQVYPIQIIDIYDENFNVVPRNSSSIDGYYQVSPNVVYFNDPQDGETFSINYYYTPDDYEEADEVAIPAVLLNAIQYFMAHKALETFRDAGNMSGSQMYLQRYQQAINKFVATTDNTNLDTTVEINRIWQRNLV